MFPRLLSFGLVMCVVVVYGCDRRPPLAVTPEQAVYESLFLKVTEDFVSPYRVAASTESRWFTENPYNEEYWARLVADLGVSLELVQRLYEHNQTPSPLDWTPVITNGELLDESFAARDPRIMGGWCHSDEQPSAEMRDGERSMYRRYYTVSRVAFSDEGDVALVKLSLHCAPMGGSGEFFVVFEWSGNSWEFRTGYTLWIS